MNQKTKPCPYCKAPCSTVVNIRGGEHGWATSDEQRTEYTYAPPVHLDINISMTTMRESNGRVTYAVLINRNGKQLDTDHSQRKNRTEYELARWKHLLLDGPEPDIMDYPDEKDFVEIPYNHHYP